MDELKIPLIERELKCLSDFKTSITQKFDNRKPAELTLEFINKTNLEMQKQTDNLNSLTKTLDTHVQDQKTHDAERKIADENLLKMLTDFINSADGKYADSEQFRFWRNVLITGLILSIVIGIWLNK